MAWGLRGFRAGACLGFGCLGAFLLEASIKCNENQVTLQPFLALLDPSTSPRDLKPFGCCGATVVCRVSELTLNPKPYPQTPNPKP